MLLQLDGRGGEGQPSQEAPPPCHLDLTKLIQAGLKTFFNNPALSDITLVCPDGRALHCHSVILAAASRRLASALTHGSWSPGQQMPVKGIDSDALETLVRAFYTAECPLDLLRVPALYDAASKLEVPSLIPALEQFVGSALQPHNCCQALEACLGLGVDTLAVLICEWIRGRVQEVIPSAEYRASRLDTAVFICKDLAQRSQLVGLQAAVSWLSVGGPRSGLVAVMAEAAGLPVDALQAVAASGASLSALGFGASASLLGGGGPGGGAGTSGAGAGRGGPGGQQLDRDRERPGAGGVPPHEGLVGGPVMRMLTSASSKAQAQGLLSGLQQAAAVGGEPLGGAGQLGTGCVAGSLRGQQGLGLGTGIGAAAAAASGVGLGGKGLGGGAGGGGYGADMLPDGPDAEGDPGRLQKRLRSGLGGAGPISVAGFGGGGLGMPGGGGPMGLGEMSSPMTGHSGGRPVGGVIGIKRQSENEAPTGIIRPGTAPRLSDDLSGPDGGLGLASSFGGVQGLVGRGGAGRGRLPGRALESPDPTDPRDSAAGAMGLGSLGLASGVGPAGGGMGGGGLGMGNNRSGSSGRASRAGPMDFEMDEDEDGHGPGGVGGGMRMADFSRGSSGRDEGDGPAGGGITSSGGGGGKSTPVLLTGRSVPAQKGVCHVEGCQRSLLGLRDYYQRYKICEYHLKVSSVLKDGVPHRFCQQCGRFHPLTDFDGDRRSCRTMLARHSHRRAKQKQELAEVLAQRLEEKQIAASMTAVMAAMVRSAPGAVANLPPMLQMMVGATAGEAGGGCGGDMGDHQLGVLSAAAAAASAAGGDTDLAGLGLAGLMGLAGGGGGRHGGGKGGGGKKGAGLAGLHSPPSKVQLQEALARTRKSSALTQQQLMDLVGAEGLGQGGMGGEDGDDDGDEAARFAGAADLLEQLRRQRQEQEAFGDGGSGEGYEEGPSGGEQERAGAVGNSGGAGGSTGEGGGQGEGEAAGAAEGSAGGGGASGSSGVEDGSGGGGGGARLMDEQAMAEAAEQMLAAAKAAMAGNAVAEAQFERLSGQLPPPPPPPSLQGDPGSGAAVPLGTGGSGDTGGGSGLEPAADA